jgi:hypothetical protein
MTAEARSDDSPRPWTEEITSRRIQSTVVDCGKPEGHWSNRCTRTGGKKVVKAEQNLQMKIGRGRKEGVAKEGGLGEISSAGVS